MNLLFAFLYALVCLTAFLQASPALFDDGISGRAHEMDIKERSLRGSSSSSEDASPPRGEGSHRMTFQVRTTLLNVNVDELTPEETIFFEDTWIRVFNQVLLGPSSHIDNNNDKSALRLRSFVVEEVLNDRRRLAQNDARELKRFRRGIDSYRWFDIWALVETSCRFCGDYRRVLKGTKEKSKGIFQELETTLCQELQNGPLSCFHDVDECRVVYMNA